MITIIPAIDIIGGKCVRLTQGEYASMKIYYDDPLEAARQFEDAGIRRLHLVDLDGARKKKIVNGRTLERIASRTQLKIDFGGGIQSNDDIHTAFELGAAQVTAGSIAVKNEMLVRGWLARYGTERIILGADVRDGKIAIHGWQEQSEIVLKDFVRKYYKAGIKSLICTDISRDGMMSGPAMELYLTLKKSFPELYLIASGGISSIDDITVLNDSGIDAVITGKAIYEGKIKLEELKPYLC